MAKNNVKIMINLTKIKNEIQSTNLETARNKFAPNSKISASGIIAKITTKESDLIAIIESEMKIFASMANADLVAFKKGQQIKIEGVLQSFGFNSICLTDCRIITA